MNFLAVRKGLLMLIFLSLIMMPLSGCIYLAAGGVGALGGYIVSPDTVEGVIEGEYAAVWQTIIDITSIMGKIEEKHDQEGSLLSIINGAKVEIGLLQLDDDSLRLRIKARKAFFPRISIAQDIYVKIMNRVGY